MIKELPYTLRKNGYDYTLIMRDDFGYIYAQVSNGRIIAYEVFKRVLNERFQCVSFPGNEAFGLWAWTFWDLNQAKDKLSKFSTHDRQPNSLAPHPGETP